MVTFVMSSSCPRKLPLVFFLLCFIIIIVSSFQLFSQPVLAASMNMQNDSGMNMSNNNAMNDMDMSDMSLPPPNWAFNIGKLGKGYEIFEIDTSFYHTLVVILDFISLIVALFSLYRIIRSIREYGKSTLGVAMIYLLNATIVLGAVMMMFIFADGNIYRVHDITGMTLWHIMFCYAVILFFVAANILSTLVNISHNYSSYPKALWYLCFSILLSISIIIAMPYTDKFFVKYVQPTTFSQDGYFHIVAFLLSVIAAVYLYRIRKKYPVIGSVIGQLYIVLAILAAIHLWELLIESWKWVILSSDMGELGDRILWIPVFIYIFNTYDKLKTPSMNDYSENSQDQTPAPPLPPVNPTGTILSQLSSQVQSQTQPPAQQFAPNVTQEIKSDVRKTQDSRSELI